MCTSVASTWCLSAAPAVHSSPECGVRWSGHRPPFLVHFPPRPIPEASVWWSVSSQHRLLPVHKASWTGSVICMAPEEEKMTRRSPLDFPIEWERPKPGRRPDIFPQFSPMKTPLPAPLPEDPPEEDEEEEEKKDEEEEDPDKEEPEKPDKQV